MAKFLPTIKRSIL